MANELLRASKFYGGMPSEFMGESWLAIRKVLENKIKISTETFILSEGVYKQIVEGFNLVGQKLPK